MLNKMTRCDRCPAEAQQEVFIFGTVLLFCQHHYNKHEAALLLQGGENITAPTAEQQTDEEDLLEVDLNGVKFPLPQGLLDNLDE